MNPNECHLRSVRWAQLSLIRKHIERLTQAMEGMPPVDNCLGPGAIPYSDSELADHYLELRDRVEETDRALKRLHFRMCGKFAQELRTMAGD